MRRESYFHYLFSIVNARFVFVLCTENGEFLHGTVFKGWVTEFERNAGSAEIGQNVGALFRCKTVKSQTMRVIGCVEVEPFDPPLLKHLSLLKQKEFLSAR